MTIILNDINVVNARNLNYYEWENIYKNNTYLDPENFIKIIKENNISQVHYFISNCPSANVVNFYFKHQDQSFACVVIYKKDHTVNQSCLTNQRLSRLEFQILMLIIVCISLFILYLLHKHYHQKEEDQS